jgi:hypothetical protein
VLPLHENTILEEGSYGHSLDYHAMIIFFSVEGSVPFSPLTYIVTIKNIIFVIRYGPTNAWLPPSLPFRREKIRY